MKLSWTRAIQWVGILAVLVFVVALRYEAPSEAGMQLNAPIESPLSQGMRGYWKLDTGSGTNATDSSGNGNTLSMTGSPSWTTGNIGPYSLDFSGTGQYLSIASPSSALDFADGASFTLTGWFNRDTFAADHTILSSKSAQTTSDGYIIWIDNNAGNDYLMFRADENGSTDAYTLTSSTNFSSTGWHHFAVSWNESAPNAVLYIDGNAEGSASGTAFASMGDLSNTNPFSIGAETDGGLPFDGKLDDIRVYGYALSADQVKKLYNTTSPTQPVDTSLVGHWTFDGNDIQGTTAIDRSSFGNNGTITGATKTIGKLGQALSFNGSSDYINAGSANSLDNIDLQGGGGMSISVWVMPRSEGAYSLGIIAAKDFGASGEWHMGTGISGRISFTKNYSGTDLVITTGDDAYVLNQWTHIVLTWDGSAAAINAHIYSNGAEVSYITQVDGTSSKLTDASNDLLVGCAYGYCFDGSIDDLRVYNRVLSSGEISDLYNVGK